MALLFSACAGSRPVPDVVSPQSGVADTSLHFQLIYVVHGDADYTYHDTSGGRFEADTEAVAQARETAAYAPHSEVFIFHQQERPWKVFSDGLDGRMEQYVDGKLTARLAYSRKEEADFESEANLLRRHSRALGSKPLTRFFVYFGHEIPPVDGLGYSHSWPDKNFSRKEFLRGLSRFTPADSLRKPFALAVLSTCYGGTPPMITGLAPYAAYAVASPAYLHLSFLDARALGQGFPPDSISPNDSEIHALADSVAKQSFRHLQRNTQTEITVAVYDLSKILPAEPAPTFALPPTQFKEYHDCAQDSGFDAGATRVGVGLNYQPPRFGILKDKTERSGWECPGNKDR